MNNKYLPIDLSEQSINYTKNNFDNLNLIKIIEKENFTKVQSFLIEKFVYYFDKEKHKFLHTKIWDIVSDLSKIIIIINKINYIKKKKLIPIYNKTYNPIFYILFNSIKLESNDYTFLMNDKYKNYFSKLINFKSNILSFFNSDNTKLTFMKNYFLNEIISKSKYNEININFHRIYSMKFNPELPREFNDLSHQYANEIFQNIEINSENINNNKLYLNILILIIRFHLLEIIHFKNFVYKNKYLFKFKHFMTGSPKFWGRAISFFYIENGKEVSRFSHSLDRVFFKDPLFKYSEYIFANNYYFPSYESSIAAKNLIKTTKYDKFNFENINFESFESDFYKKKYLHSKSINNKRINVLYCSSTYLYEKNLAFPNDRIEMINYYEWQSWLLNYLNKQNFKLFFKKHPKSFNEYNNINFNVNSLAISKGFSYNEILNFDIIIFDYAGSLLFETMASNIGIIFIDFGCRTWNNYNKHIFSGRCEVIETFLDKKFRYRINTNVLNEKLYKALKFDHNKNEYLNKYVFEK